MTPEAPNPPGGSYDPEQFWDRKAARKGGDDLRAVCCDDLDSGGGRGARGLSKPWWLRLIDHLDILVDPYLGALLPSGACRRALMVFRKSGAFS